MAEKFAVYEWASAAGEPSIIQWFETFKQASDYYSDCIQDAIKRGDKETEYGIIEIKVSWTFTGSASSIKKRELKGA
jgi:hypothetical protein